MKIYVCFLLLLVHTFIFSQSPVNPNSTPSVNEVLQFLHNIKGHGILSGQENLATDVTYWTDLVVEKTGKYPALLGEDFSYGDSVFIKRQKIVDAAIDYWDNGGLVTISWRQVNPDSWDCSVNEGPFSNSQVSMTQERFNELLDPATEIHEKYIRHIDTIARYLKILESNNVVVLWRPYHEMNGAWFWWGGKTNFSDLWNLMYDRYTNYHQLNNLIWVWAPNITRNREDRLMSKYYPGNDKVDILGMDGYNDSNNWDLLPSDGEDLDEITGLKPNNPIAFTEIGKLPDPDWLQNSRPNITWFLCWWTHITKNHTDEEIKNIYNHPYVLSRDDIPSFSDGDRSFAIMDLILQTLDSAENLYHSNIAEYTNGINYPSALSDSGTLKNVKLSNWVSGFYPGCLWYMYEYSKNPAFRSSAEIWTEGLSSNQSNTYTHDLGFMMYCSYGNGYRLTDNADYKNVLLKTSESLISRYNENVGCIRSWDWGSWKFPVIIDNMMNLEMLEWASKNSSDTSYRYIARSHADLTLMHHFREDNSSYHVVDYNPINGEVISKGTFQGYSDASAWARGQAWGLYGYTMMFRETGDSAYLEQAIHIADYFISGLPDDYIPYWDFDAPNIPDEPKDASSAAIAASALIELSQFKPPKADIYFLMAERMLESLMSEQYLAAPGTNGPFLLKHSTGNKNSNSDVDVPIIYADYYFLEALLKYKDLAGIYIKKLNDVSLYEDFGTYTVLDNVVDFYQLDTASSYKIKVQTSNNLLDVFINSDNQLIVNSYENLNGIAGVNVILVIDSTRIVDYFNIHIKPIDDPPVAFNLLKPENNRILNDLRLTFDWEDSSDPDGGSITYQLFLYKSDFDTVINISESELCKDFQGLLPLNDTLNWYVIADDGSITTQSEVFSLILSVLSIDAALGNEYIIQVFPNPVQNEFYIQSPNNNLSGKEISIYNNMGKLVFQGMLIHTGADNIFTLERKIALDRGVYIYNTEFLNISNQQKKAVGKFIIE